jgi:hypothetical protein
VAATLALVVLVAGIGAVAVAAGEGNGSEQGGRAAPVDQPNERFFADGAQFAVECGFSHSARVDPIVWPGQTGRSHRHDFFGATAVDAGSTGADLVRSPTTCRVGADTAAYWAPSLVRRGQPVTPGGATAYYRVAPGVEPTEVVAYPLGLAAIAGDATAAAPQPSGVVGWGCGRGGPVAATIPACAVGSPLQLRVTFPDCWDGERLDSADHRSHLAYSGADGCGGDHPVALPRLTLVIHYPVSGEPAGLSLASGDPRTAHADFLNGWGEEALRREVESCLHRAVVCTIPDSARTAASVRATLAP